MGIPREQRDQSQQNGGQNRDPALPVESHNRSQLSLQAAWAWQGGMGIRGTTAEAIRSCRRWRPRLTLVRRTARNPVDALLTLSSKGQLVIPARMRELLGLQPGDRLALSLEADGLRLVPVGQRHTVSAQSLIGCTGYAGAPLRLEQMDPALYSQP